MKRVLVTGGAGFIGIHTCLLLLEQNFEVYVIDSCINSSEKALERLALILSLNKKEFQKKLKFFKVDIRNKTKIYEIFSNFQRANIYFDAVIHFAGLKSVANSVNNPIEYWDVNVKGTINLLDIMNKFDCNTIVFSSSASIYGSTHSNLLDEDSEINPFNPYALTKSVIEKFLNNIFMSSNKKWRIANLRYFNPIGAHESGLIGEDPRDKPNNLFPLITMVALGKLNALKVFGNDWPTKDGTGVRDYIHVMDLADGHVKTLNYLNEEEPQILNLNLGTGQDVSVIELIETFEKVNRISIPYSYAQRRDGDVARLVADNSLALNKLDWRPNRSLEEMCSDGWNWSKLNPQGF